MKYKWYCQRENDYYGTEDKYYDEVTLKLFSSSCWSYLQCHFRQNCSAFIHSIEERKNPISGDVTYIKALVKVLANRSFD